jgi:hypothetical protein
VSPPLPPLRTVRAAFTAHGSSRLCPVASRPPLVLPPLVTITGSRQRLSFPSGSRRLPGSVSAHQTHVSTLSGQASPYPAGYDFPLPFGCWPSLLGSSSPAGEFAFLTVGLLLGEQTSTGFPRSARSRRDRGGCLLYRGETWCPRRKLPSLRPTIGDRLSLTDIGVSTAFADCHRPQHRFTLVHPSGLLLARVPLAVGYFLRRSPLLRTRRLPGTPQGSGDRPGHWPGGSCLTLPCDLVSHPIPVLLFCNLAQISGTEPQG